MRILKDQLLTLGYNDAAVIKSTSENYLSRRLSRECLLGGSGDGTCGLVHTTTYHFAGPTSTLASAMVHFTASVCGHFVLVCDGTLVYVYQLKDALVEYIATVSCPRRVLAVSMDTSAGRYSVATLLVGRTGFVVDILANIGGCISPKQRNIYKDICSEDDPPRSVAICPGRACVAYGCQGGIELHWLDSLTGQDLSRWFPLSAPSDFLYFLAPRKGIDTAKKLRLISSAVQPEEVPPIGRRFGVTKSSFAYWGEWQPGEFGASQSDHFMAVPVANGMHVMFTDPRDGMVYLGGDAPVSSSLVM